MFTLSNLPPSPLPDINECEREGCGDPLEDCMNSAGSFECICKNDYHRVGGKCVLEGDDNKLTIVLGVHCVMLMMCISSLGVKGAAVISVLYLLTGGVYYAVSSVYQL